MKTSRNGNNKKVFTMSMKEKLAVTVLVTTLALFGLVVVLYRMIKDKNEDYTQIVLNQHSSYDSRTIPYRRGDIVDRNGTYLATSEKVYNLILDPNQINQDKENYLEPTVSALCEVFGYDRADILATISANENSYYVPYEKQISADKKEEFETKKKEMNDAYAKSKEDSGKKIKGVWFEDEYRRFYPYNTLACNVVGFSYDNGKQGSGGIEQYYNDQLTGTNGREYGYLDDESNMEKVIKSAENGNTIVSTIDVNIQRIVEKYIDEWMSGIGSKTAAVIAMDPRNGEILAMSSNRRFDLNNPRDLSYAYSQEEITAMTDEGRMDAWNQMWRNFCVNDTYEPGSPAKPMTVAAGLEEGVISQNDTFLCDGGQDVGGYRIKCSNIYGHGILTLEQSLMKSCNDAMMQIAAKLGVQRFAKYQKLFGMGQKTGIDLPGEAYGLIYNADNMGPTDLAVNSFGQSYNSTMIQMAAAFASVINGGSYYEPHVVKQILNDQGSVVKKIEPNLVRETVSQSTSDFIRHALFMTVDDEEGTGKAGRVAGYKVGGKTGTAEKLPRSAHNYLVSFCGFAPADDPQLLMYVVIDTPNLPGKEQAHSTFATEVFQKIMAEALPYLNVFPDTDTTTEDASLADQNEGITNNNEGGLEPGTGETAAVTEAPTDAEGNVIQTEPAPEEEVIPYDDGLGLPDDMPSDGSGSAAESAGEAQSMESVQETEIMENGAEETTQAAQ